jgi:hypothetical protein
LSHTNRKTSAQTLFVLGENALVRDWWKLPDN